MEYKNVKGTHDIFGPESELYDYITETCSDVAKLFGYKKTTPPVLERSELFTRSVGESSDVVRKEMYTFLDKGNRSITLRPEFTAGIVRLIVQNKLLFENELPVKCFYYGPVFRYERPQLGRYRQFNQLGVETIGSNNAMVDVDTILCALTMLNMLDLKDVTLKINTLGDQESRNNYKNALINYFEPHINNMCEDCRERFETNPLRILDCKDENDRKIIADAPKISNYLSLESKNRFDAVLNLLTKMNVKYEIDETLVRGLDYYSETVFEFHYVSEAGNNYGAIGAGGHYSNLVSEVGGPNVPGIGFSFGVERLASVLMDDNKFSSESSLDLYAISTDERYDELTYAITMTARSLGLISEMCMEKAKLGSLLKKASKKNAKFALIIGEDEFINSYATIKDMNTTEQYKIPFEDFENNLNKLFTKDDCCDCDCDCEDEHCHCHCHCDHKED